MKKIVLVLILAAAAAIYDAAAARTNGHVYVDYDPQALQGKSNAGLTKEQKSYFANRRICVKRDTETLPGYVITYWHRNGKPDTKGPAVITNALQKIVGAEQKNPIQELAEQMRQRADEWHTVATNNAARVERVTAALDERRAEYVQKRDEAVLPTTKAIYQTFIDIIDELKAKLMNPVDLQKESNNG